MSSEDGIGVTSSEDIENTRKIASVTFLARAWGRRTARIAQRLGPSTTMNEKLTYQQVLAVVSGEQSVKSVMKMLNRICNLTNASVSPHGHARIASGSGKRKFDDFNPSSLDDGVCPENDEWCESAHGISLEGYGDIGDVVMDVDVKTNIHKFMAAFLIVYNLGKSMFDMLGPREETLLQKAENLLTVYERICRGILQTPSSVCGSTSFMDHVCFRRLLCDFFEAFDLWSKPHLVMKVIRVQNLLNGLYHADELLVDGHAEAAVLHIQFLAQRHILRVYLTSLQGDAVAVFRMEIALMQARATRCQNRSTEKVPGDVLSPMNSYQPQKNGEVHSGDGLTDATRHTFMDDVSDEALRSSVMTALNATNPADYLVPSRATLQPIYELLVDPSFRVRADGDCGLEHPSLMRVRVALNATFFDTMVQELSTEPLVFTNLLLFLQELHGSIVDLQIPAEHETIFMYNSGRAPWAGVKESIDRVINIPTILQKIADGKFQWDDWCKLIQDIATTLQQHRPPPRILSPPHIQICLSLCKPFAELSRWKSILQTMQQAGSHGNEGLKPRLLHLAMLFFKNIVRTARLDVYNRVLDSQKDFAKNRGYESMVRMVGPSFQGNESQLLRSHAWIRRSIQLDDGSCLRNFASACTPQQKISAHVDILTIGTVDLICRKSVTMLADKETFPETLLYDIHRVRSMRREINFYIVLSALVSLLSSWAQRNFAQNIGKTYVHDMLGNVAKCLLESEIMSDNVQGLVEMAVQETNLFIRTRRIMVFKSTAMNVDIAFLHLKQSLLESLRDNNNRRLNIFASMFRRTLLARIISRTGTTPSSTLQEGEPNDRIVPRSILAMLHTKMQTLLSLMNKMISVNSIIFEDQYASIIMQQVTSKLMSDFRCE